MTNEDLNKRLEYIEKRQALLEGAVSTIQRKLYEAMLEKLEKVYDDPTAVESIFSRWTKVEHVPVIQTFGSDLITIGTLNADYFQELTEMSNNAFTPIKREVGRQMLERFGLTERGKLIEAGFLDSFIQDTSVKRDIKQYCYRTKTSGAGLDEFRKGLKRLITDTEDSTGLLSRYYRNFALNTYNDADRTTQVLFSDRLDLQAFLYAGGNIRGTRDFCRARNGKVFLKEEAKEWEKLEFDGKGKNYTWDRLGNHGCRHSMNFLTNEMALRRRPDLELVDGRLQVKG